MDMLKQEPLIIINACSNKPHCRLPTLPTASICPGPGIIKMKSAILTRQTGQNKSADPILLCARIFIIFIVFFSRVRVFFFSFLLFHFDVRSYFDSFVRGTCGPINNTEHRPWLIFPEPIRAFLGAPGPHRDGGRVKSEAEAVQVLGHGHSHTHSTG